MKAPLGYRIASAVLLVGLLSLVGCSEPTAPPRFEPDPDFALGNGTPVGDIAPVDLGTLGGSVAFATDINDSGWIVGLAATVGSSDWSAFLVQPGQAMQDLGTGSRSQANAVNNNGQIVGLSGGPLGFFWDAGEVTSLQGGVGCGSTTCRTFPWGVNDRGVVVGQLLDASFQFVGATWFTQNSSSTFVAQGLVGASGGVGNDINNDGTGNDGRIVGQAPFGGQQQSALWPAPNNPPALRGPLSGDVKSGATAINDNQPAQIVGWSEASDNLRRPFFVAGGANDAPTPLPLASGFAGGEAQDINDSQVIVGWLITEPFGPTRAAIWPSPTDDPILLRGAADNLGGDSKAVAINESCHVVGEITNGAGETRAALWEIGGCDGGPPANVPPTADPDGPYEGTVGVPVDFEGTGSADSDGTIASYVWDFGDGNTGAGPTTSHAYAAAGTYTVSLTVTDDDGASDTRTSTATISEGGPTDPGEAMEALIDAVADLGDSGSLSGGNAEALTEKLKAAQQSLDKGNGTAAANQLGAFINQVEALVRSGRLSGEEAASLRDGAQAIIDELGG